MKKFLLLVFSVFSLGVNAQVVYEQPKFFDNVSVGVFSGVGTPLSFTKVFPLNTSVGVRLSKDITPKFGMSAEGAYTWNESNLASFRLNSHYNLIKAGKFILSPEVGAGLDWDLHGGVDPAVKTGLLFTYDNPLSFYINPTINWRVNDMKFNKNCSNLGVYIGIQYRFGKFKSHNLDDYKSLNEQQNDEINKLRKELDKKPKERIIIKNETISSDRVVFFSQNSSDLSDASKRTLDLIPWGSNVILEGYASPEGSKSYNKELSEKRCSVVEKYLKNRKVNVGKSTGFGCVDETSNRVVIIKVN